mmetsp:Transcript_77260/g.196211  ORF Transcript_77260/g.196211 Transcript_77260/m.196211 type:complete len:353 (-) Transcript_77260:230-1288(-)
MTDHVEVTRRCAPVGGRDGAVVRKLAVDRADLARKAHLALKILLCAGAVLARSWSLELLAVEALRRLLPPRVRDLASEHALFGALAVGGHPSLVVGGDGIRCPDTLAQRLPQRLEVQVVHHARVPSGAVEQELGRGGRRLRHYVVHLQRDVRKLKVVPALALVPGKHNLLGLPYVVGHDHQAAVVAKLVDEGTFVRLRPSQAAVSGEEGVRLIRLKAQVRAHVASAHNDPDGILRGVERCIVLKVCNAMQMQPAPVRRALDLCAARVHGRRLEVGPDAAFVEGDDRADDGLVLRLGLGCTPLVHLGARGGLGLEVLGVLEGVGLLAGDALLLAVSICAGHVLEVCHVDAFQA